MPGSTCVCASLDSRLVTEKAGRGAPTLVPICWQMGWSGKTSGGHNLLSKAVGALLLARIKPQNVILLHRTSLTEENSLFLEEIKKKARSNQY